MKLSFFHLVPFLSPGRTSEIRFSFSSGLPRTCKDIQVQTGKQDDKEFFLTINSKKIKVLKALRVYPNSRKCDFYFFRTEIC